MVRAGISPLVTRYTVVENNYFKGGDAGIFVGSIAGDTLLLNNTFTKQTGKPVVDRGVRTLEVGSKVLGVEEGFGK